MDGDQINPGSEQPATIVEPMGGASVVIPHGTLLLEAEYSRTGADLVLEGRDGQSVIVADYFKQDVLPNLVTEGGAQIRGAVVEKLAGPEMPGQYAQADGDKQPCQGDE